MNIVFLACFLLGLALSLLTAFSGFGRIHIGHFHFGGHIGQNAHPPATGHVSFFNGFTLPAFLCWFGGAGYLLLNYSAILTPVVLLVAAAAGLLGASMFYALLAKVLIPAERILTPEDTHMPGVVARISNEIRAGNGIGEILYSQMGSRRSAAARSDSGLPIPRGTEVVVLRYDRGVAYVSPLPDLDANQIGQPLNHNLHN